MEKINESKFKFKDGTRINAYRGFIGINDELQVSGGYDGYITCDWSGEWELEDYSVNKPLTPEIRAEIADYMIGLWNRFKNAR